MITVENILQEIGRIVGERPDRRWTRASLTLKGSDGMSRESFFNDHTIDSRVKLVSERVGQGAGWSQFLQRDISKGYGKDGTRPICWATCIDTALIYALTEAIEPHVEGQLTDVAVAYRPGRRMHDSMIDAISRARARGLTTVCVSDVKGFYDNIPWGVIDQVIDELPADAGVKSMLKGLIRVDVRRVEDGSVVQRERGVPQGLPISPILANLALAAFDKAVAATCGKLGCIIRRYADDIIVFAPTVQAGQRAREIVRRQLGVLQLKVKDGTGAVIDLAQDDTSATWLGIRMRGLSIEGATQIAMDVPEATVAGKAVELRAELEAGLTSRADIDERLTDLGRYWARLMPSHQAAKAVDAIRQGVVPLGGKTAIQEMKNFVENMSMNKKEEKNTQKTIEELIHPSNRTPRTSRDGDGKKGTTRRVTFKVQRRVERISNREPLSCDGLHALPGGQVGLHGEDAPVVVEAGDTSSTATPGVVASDEVAAATVDTASGLELSRPDLRVSARRDGVPDSPHPARPRKQVTIRAEPYGPRVVFITVEIDGVAEPERPMRVADSRSTTEAVLTGFWMTLVGFGSPSVDARLVTSDPTINGYIEHGWRVRSLRVLKLLRELQALGVNIAATEGTAR